MSQRGVQKKNRPQTGGGGLKNIGYFNGEGSLENRFASAMSNFISRKENFTI